MASSTPKLLTVPSKVINIITGLGKPVSRRIT
jgi:hypothetical protein